MSTAGEEEDDDDVMDSEPSESEVEEGPVDNEGMAYERLTTSYTRLSAVMQEQRRTQRVETDAVAAVDPGMQFKSAREAICKILRSRYGSVVRGWREGLDVRQKNIVTSNDFFKVLRKLGYHGDLKLAWKELAGEQGEKITLANIDPRASQVLADFYRGLMETGTVSSARKIVEGTDALRIGLPLFLQRCKPVMLMSQEVSVDLKEVFRFLATGDGSLTEEDCLWLEYFVTRKRPLPAKSVKQLEEEERVEALKVRNMELAKKRELSNFKEALKNRFGSVIAGWREVLDPDEEGSISWEMFEDGAKQLGFTGNLDAIWEELLDEEEEFLELERLEPRIVEVKKSFTNACIDRFGSLDQAFVALDVPDKPLVKLEDFNVLCIEIGMQKSRRLFFEYLDAKGTGVITLESIDSQAALRVFGRLACDSANDELVRLQPPSKKRKSLFAIAQEQCALTRRNEDELPSARKELVKLLEDKYDSCVRAWAKALDPQAKGKLKRKEFLTGISVLGYKGNTTKLWEEMQLKPKASLKFKDLCPECVEEIREFKLIAGKKIVGLIQTSEAAAGVGKSKKAGVPVDNEEFFKLLDAIDYQGNEDRLHKHLDPGSKGFINTRTLRILNEQKSEEKAIPQYLKKFRDAEKSLLEQKLAAIVVPPAKELLAKQDKLIQAGRDERSSKMEMVNAKKEFISGLNAKFGSIAKAWRLALDPENSRDIENVEKLMRGLKRAGQIPEEGTESALRKKAEQIFQACQKEDAGLVTLEDLDPLTPQLMEKLKDMCEIRFGSVQEAFERYDPDGQGWISKQDFKHMCQSVQLIDGVHRICEFLDPKDTNKIVLAYIDSEVAADAKKAIQIREEEKAKIVEEIEKKGAKHMTIKPKPLGVSCGPEAAKEEREKKPAKQLLAELKQKLVKKHGTLIRTWKTLFKNPRKEIGKDSFLQFFEDVGMQQGPNALAVWNELPKTGPKQKLSLAVFDGDIDKDFKEFRKKIAERYGSIKAMFLELDDKDENMSMNKKQFFEVCYECQLAGNEGRLFEYLDRKDSKVIDFKEIDEKVAKQIKHERAEKERKRLEREERRRLREEAAKEAAAAALLNEDGQEPGASADAAAAGDGAGAGGDAGEAPSQEVAAVEETEATPSAPSKPRLKAVPPPALVPPEPPTLGGTFRNLLDRRFGSLVKAWRAIDSYGMVVLTKDEFCKAVARTGYAGNPSALFKALLQDAGDEEEGISMREVNPKVFRHLAAFRRACKRTLGSFEKAFEEGGNGETTKRYQESEFLSLCEKVEAPKPWSRIFNELNLKGTGSITWDDVCFLELQWAWEGTKEKPIRGTPKLDVHAGRLAGSPARTEGMSHLCLGLRPRMVSLKKSTSLPSLKIGIRAKWHERHTVPDNIGTRDMNLIYEMTKVQTQDQERVSKRVTRKMMQTSTIQWLEDGVTFDGPDATDMFGAAADDPAEEEEDDF
eukprot:TRINITY_DN39818_c0_g1_i1.p1 TRINITY_DN39818_c0_g1~~TRINITY_DN39818_c0_g1_i1.p1  ORF type:complete len:1451 (-),score=442.06 TRINITY_DN39818_c0_g1_i1:195-4547(-)